jgi:hypothetical protein
MQKHAKKGYSKIKAKIFYLNGEFPVYEREEMYKISVTCGEQS